MKKDKLIKYPLMIAFMESSGTNFSQMTVKSKSLQTDEHVIRKMIYKKTFFK